MQINMRKALALLMAVAMLCTLIPLSGLAVTAADVDVLVNGNFETGDGNGWKLESGTSVSTADVHGGSYALKTTNTATKYQTMARQYIDVKANTDYVFTFWYKYVGSNSAPQFYAIIKDSAESSNLNDDTRTISAATGAWTKVSFTFNTGENDQVVVVMQNRTANDGGTYYFDDFSMVGPEPEEIVEPANPVPEVSGNLVSNGNFETGHSDGWEKFQSTVFTAEAAYTGLYGAKLVGDGGWGGMLSQSVAVEAGLSYKVSMWVKTVSNGVNIQIKDGGANGAKLGSDWFTGKEWTYKTWTVSPTTNSLYLNFCGGGNSVAETVYLDDVVVTKAPLIENGDFETGDKTGWSCNSGTATIVTDAHGGNYALQLSNPSQWGEAAIRTIGVKPNTQYEVSFWSKRVSGTGSFNLVVSQTVSPWTKFEKLSGQNWMNETSGDWVKYTCVYNSGENTQMLVKFTTEVEGGPGTIIIDDVTVEELKEPSFDGYIYNGDFETGKSSGWDLMQQSEISEAAACNGQYGLHLKGNGGWGTMADQVITTVPGQNYAFYAYLKTNAAGSNVQIKDKGTDTKLASTWYNKTDWRLVQLNFIAESESTRIIFSGGGTGTGENVYVDDIFIVPTKPMTNDGYIFNGDFESGSLTGWNTHQQTVLSNKAAHDGSAGVIMKGTGWGGTINQTFYADMGNTYKLSFWYKPISNGINLQILNEADGSKITSQYLSTSDGSDWILFEKTFNVGYATKVTLNFCGSGASSADEMYIDSISIVNVDGEENVRNTLTDNGGSSVRDVADDNRGLAFRFHLNADGVQIKEGNKFVANSGTVDLYKNREQQGKLVRAGAVVTRKADIGESFADFTLDSVDAAGQYTIDIPAVYLIEKTSNRISYVVRIVEIPDNHTATEIYARPYYVYDVDGEEVTVYGTMVHGNYDGVAGDHNSIKVLAIGDDSSVDAMQNHLGNILQSADYDQVVLGNLYNDGALNYAADYTYAQYQYGKWSTESGVGAADVLAEDWDYVVIQSAEDEDPSNLQAFIGDVDAATDAPLYWNMPWAIDGTYEDIVADAQAINNVNIIPTGTALENILGTGLNEDLFITGDSLNDGCGDYIAALTWYAVLTGDTLDQVTYYPVAVYNYAYDTARAVAHAMYAPYAVSDLSEVILLAGSDFQPTGGVEEGRQTVRSILGALADAGYGLFDGFLSGGDYSGGTTEEETSAGLAGLDAEISQVVYNNKFYSQGNHDPETTVGLTGHGNNDPLNGPYGLYVIDEDSYTDLGVGGEQVAKELDAYFAEKLDSNWGNKPIFVLCHVPLNFSMRTHKGQNARTAMPIVESLNEAGAAGLNIIFLFGHNHSGGYDNYIGGGSVYLKKGDTMLVPDYDNYLVPAEVTLNFTYMTAGYLGYYGSTYGGADGALSMTVFRIQQDGSVIVGRYTADGIHELKAAGVKNEERNDIMEADPTVYDSYRVVTSDDDQPYNAE